MGAATTLIACVGIAAHADIIDHSMGFAKHDDLVASQSANEGLTWDAFADGNLRLTDTQVPPNGDPFEATTVFTKKQVDISHFTTEFTFQLSSNTPTNMADGITFTIQNAPDQTAFPTSSGGAMAYESIGNSVCVKFDCYQNLPDPSDNTTGLFVGGQYPCGGTDLYPTGINLHSGHLFQVVMNYDGKALTIDILDTVTHAEAEQTYQIDIPAHVGGDTAFVGFTGSDGGAVALQQIMTWTYNSEVHLSGLTLSNNNVAGSLSTTGTVTLNGPARQDTVVLLKSNNPAAQTPASVTVPEGASSVTFPITTTAVSSAVSGLIVATLPNDPDPSDDPANALLTVRPISVSTIKVAANYIPEGSTTTGTVTLEAPAAPGNIMVNLSSNNPAVATVPATVTVPAGATSVTFPIQTNGVSANTPILFTASVNGRRGTTTLTVRPLKPQTLTLSASSLTGGGVTSGTVTLEAPAPQGGRLVTLLCPNAAVTVPPTVLVPAGALSVNFPVNTQAVATTVKTTVQASSGGLTLYANLQIAH